MDALALLCNLHADGPATLRRLRAAGVDTLAAVEALATSELSRLVERDEHGAERFRREASQLSERFLSDLLARPEGPTPASPPRSSAPIAAAPSKVEQGPAIAPVPDPGAPGAEPAARPAPVEPRTASIARPVTTPSQGLTSAAIEAVQRTWRARDAEDPPPLPSDYELDVSAETPAQARGETGPDVIWPHPPVDESVLDDVLPELEGLDQDVRAALADVGLRELEDLIEAPPLELARQTGLGYTRIVHLQFLARRCEASEEDGEDGDDADDAREDAGPPAYGAAAERSGARSRERDVSGPFA